MWRPKVACLSMVMILCAAGCAAHGHRSIGDATSAQNLLFGPSWTGARTYDTPREEWPASVSQHSYQDTVTFRETVIDRQGQNSSIENDYYRRFDFVRKGQTRR